MAISTKIPPCFKRIFPICSKKKLVFSYMKLGVLLVFLSLFGSMEKIHGIICPYVVVTRLESSGRKKRIEGNPRQVVGWTNTFKMNLLIPRRRSQPQLACPIHYKYKVSILIIHHLSNYRESQICASSCSFGAQVSRRARKVVR
jgi:hypothetical protein